MLNISSGGKDAPKQHPQIKESSMSSEQEQLPSIGKMLQMTFEKWVDNGIPRHAAVLAFYALFAVAPILLLSVEVLGWLYGQEAAHILVQQQISSFVNDPEIGEWIEALLVNVLPSSAHWWVTAGFIIALLFGATNFFWELRFVLNQIWGVPFVRDVTIAGQIRQRLQSLLMVLAGSLLIFGGFVATALFSVTAEWMSTYLGFDVENSTVSYLLLIFILFTIFFALTYKFVPNVEVAWQDVWIGAAATALLISVTRLLISLYFTHSHTSTMFGAASALVIILISVYYAAQIFFLGAEFTNVYAHTYGSGLIARTLAAKNEQSSSTISGETTGSAAQKTAKAAPIERAKPKKPVEITVTNLEPPESPIYSKLRSPNPKDVQADQHELQSDIEEHPARFKPLRPLVNLGTTLGKGILQRFRSSATADELDSPKVPPPLERLPITEPQGSISSSPKSASRLELLISIPARVFRPIRQVIVAVGVIGAISVAALVGAPYWKRREKADASSEHTPNEAHNEEKA